MNNRLKDESLDSLFEAILTLQNKEECFSFFRDLCTALELKTMSQRFHVAKMLSEHRVYSDIVEETGASTATISRVNRSLSEDYDSCGGYALVFSRLEEKK